MTSNLSVLCAAAWQNEEVRNGWSRGPRNRIIADTLERQAVVAARDGIVSIDTPKAFLCAPLRDVRRVICNPPPDHKYALSAPQKVARPKYVAMLLGWQRNVRADSCGGSPLLCNVVAFDSHRITSSAFADIHLRASSSSASRRVMTSRAEARCVRGSAQEVSESAVDTDCGHWAHAISKIPRISICNALEGRAHPAKVRTLTFHLVYYLNTGY